MSWSMLEILKLFKKLAVVYYKVLKNFPLRLEFLKLIIHSCSFNMKNKVMT